MAETWRPGGTIIDRNGEKIMELRGVKIVDKKPVKAVVYYSLAELERFLTKFLGDIFREDESKLPGVLPQSISFGSAILFPSIGGNVMVAKTDEERIRSFVDDVIEILKDRIRYRFSNIYLRIAATIIINSAFELNIWETDGETVFIPSSNRRGIQVNSETTITLPEDILRKEISSRLTSPQSLGRMRMAAKTVRYAKYKHEDLIKFVPEQAFAVLSRLYDEEKDPEQKGYLYTLAMRAYSMMIKYDTISDLPSNSDIITPIIVRQLNVYYSMKDNPFIVNLFDKNVEVADMLIKADVLSMDNYRYAWPDMFSRLTSIPDNFIQFVEEFLRKRLAMYPHSEGVKIQLYEDLKKGKFSRFYDCRLMVDAIRKGYIKSPLGDVDEGLFFFIHTMSKCSQKDLDLIRKFITPNPIMDFFLQGIKPTSATILEILRERQTEWGMYDLLSFGMEFSDENVDYNQIIDQSQAIAGDENWEPTDFKIVEGRNKFLILKDLGNGRYLAIVKNQVGSNIYTGVIKRLANFFIDDSTISSGPLFVEYIANIDDTRLREIVDFYTDLGLPNDEKEIIDDSITDLEMYKRYVINMKTIKDIVSTSK